jgi:CheY-like chemotaxis protein
LTSGTKKATRDNVCTGKLGTKRARLSTLSCIADTPANGREVLQVLEQISYDVSLMDSQMPQMDGHETIRLIRQREQSLDQGGRWKSPVDIIAITAMTVARLTGSIDSFGSR